MPEILYQSHSLEKTSEGISGSLTVWENSPVSPFDVGDTFTPVQGSPALTVEKVSIKDNVLGSFNGKLLRQWEVTIEGSNNSSGSAGTHVKYDFNISAGEKSGTMQVTNTGDNPSITLEIGDTFTVPGIGEVFCSNVKGSDDYNSAGVRTWTVIYEGSNPAVVQEADTKYTLNIENNSDGVTVYSGSKETTYTGASPSVAVNIGDTFTLPLIGQVTCTRIQTSNTEANTWSVVIEGSRGGSSSGSSSETPSLPETESVITYEINGSTVRTVAGEFIALRRSQTPITKKSITVYTSTVAAVATLGSTYEGGIAVSENITKETVKNNGVVTGSYYRHVIEVES